MEQPLADRLRPTSLEDVAGQQHLLGEKGLLRRFVEKGVLSNMIFYGPSGVGKTTVANILADKTNRPLYRLNATTASTGDIKDIMADIGTMVAPNGVLLYLDEIQYFNKRQQQSLLEFMENGKITLIASTTENPYFCVFHALLSRSTIFEFKPLTPEDVAKTVRRAFSVLETESPLPLMIEEGAVETLSLGCGGDVRKALNGVEVLFETAPVREGKLSITKEDASLVSQRSAMRYDREGDNHFDLLSALQKSIRGSDPDAAIYYLARLLVAGDLLSPCRRLLVIAAEDIGLAYPQAIAITKACVDAALQIGLPEARLPLAEAAILLATAPKSNTAHDAINAAMQDVERGNVGEIPRHLQNVHADSTGSGKQEAYRYPHHYPDRYVVQQYLPDNLVGTTYYTYGENKTEQAAMRYWKEIKSRHSAQEK